MNANKGFTLIELVVVIVILGILAVTAVPRFVDLSTEAEAAALDGVVGAMGSAMAINYAACSAGSADCVSATNCTDVTSLMTEAPAGYTVTAASLGAANGDSTACTVTQTSSSNTDTFTGIYATP